MIFCLDLHPTITFGKAGIKITDGTNDIYRCGNLIHLSYSAEEGLSLATRDGREYGNKAAIFDPLADQMLKRLFTETYARQLNRDTSEDI